MLFHAGLGTELSSLSSAQTVLLYSSSVFFLELVFTLLSTTCVDRCGRRYLLLRFLPGSGGAMLLLALAYGLEGAGMLWAKWLSLGSLLLFISCFGLGMSLAFLVNTEIFPLHLRATSYALTALVLWSSNLLINLPFLSLFNSLPGKVGKPSNSFTRLLLLPSSESLRL